MGAPISIQELRERVITGPVLTAVFAQIESITEKQTRDQKPYYELVLRDLVGVMTIRVWNDHPAFNFCSQVQPGAPVCIEGEFWAGNSYGLEVRNWQLRDLNLDERAMLFEGPEQVRERQRNEFNEIASTIESVGDPRLRRMGKFFLMEFG
jgi:type IV secretory pathway VirB3-like protein